MVSLNKVILIGNLTRDPEIRYIPSGTPVGEFGIAVNRAYTTATGERKEEVCYVKIVTWNKLAENCSKYLVKGRPVFVEGRLQSRSWETKDGEKRSTLEVIADRVQFLSRPAAKGEGAKDEAETPGASREAEADAVPEVAEPVDDVPF